MAGPEEAYRELVAKEAGKKKPSRPQFGWTTFGMVKFGDETFSHDVVVSTAGEVYARRTDDSHLLDSKELDASVDANTRVVVFGTGQYDVAKVSGDAKTWARKNKIEVVALPTPQAIEDYNKRKKKDQVTAIIHVTC
ncbi:MAG: hypothetical protein JW834_02770 [Candidatus Diapherotrites archaeon]|nr:hypothetical protein [Candidatus Diapherotrites archaeon]